jgi:ABC-type dipeptide/oligopeptide/nickel transport system ATPase component
MDLDNKQKLLYNYDFNLKKDNAICLVAGAGSGKTTTIVHTIVKLVNENNLPEHFFITTFTRSAAKDLKLKLNKYLSDDIVNKLVIGTFHEIAGYFLEKYKHNDNMLISSYDDCLYNYAELLLNDNYVEKHNYIFVDEYQDINDIQETIIERLYNRQKYQNDQKKILVVIGDDQQNIYTFRGSNINYMLNFVKKYNGEYIFLTNNYRCPKPIVEMSNNVLVTNKNKIDKIFVSAYDHCTQLENINNNIVLLSIKANQHDIDKYNMTVSKMVLKKIFYLTNGKIIGKGKKPTLAIISRYNYTLKFLETVLTRHNIKSTYSEFINNNVAGRIILSTIHGTKGLEFDHVIFIDYIPNKCTNMEELEEERRLFYVGITRVKTELTILYNNNNPSCFLRECWTINPDIFINLPNDYNKFKLDYNFFKKTEYVQHNIEQICNNLTFDEILKLNEIIPFRSFLQKNNKKCKVIKIHDKIDLDQILKKSNSDQIITCYEHLYELLGKYILFTKIKKIYNCHISLDPIQSIIFRNYGTIKNTKDINTFIEHIHKNYSIDLSKSNIDLEYLKKYSMYSYKTCPKYLDWNHMLDSKIKNKYTESINKFYGNTNNCTDTELFNVCIISDMTINNRLSMQYLEPENEILKLICNKFDGVDGLLDEIQLLNCTVLYNQIYEYNDFVLKSDFILLIENNAMVLGVISNDSPNVNHLIHHLSVAFLHNINCLEKDTIKKVNLYVPLSGLIYQININRIDRLMGTNFLNKLIS